VADVFVIKILDVPRVNERFVTVAKLQTVPVPETVRLPLPKFNVLTFEFDDTKSVQLDGPDPKTSVPEVKVKVVVVVTPSETVTLAPLIVIRVEVAVRLLISKEPLVIVEAAEHERSHDDPVIEPPERVKVDDKVMSPISVTVPPENDPVVPESVYPFPSSEPPVCAIPVEDVMLPEKFKVPDVSVKAFTVKACENVNVPGPQSITVEEVGHVIPFVVRVFVPAPAKVIVFVPDTVMVPPSVIDP
jgi:hypothetical protein